MLFLSLERQKNKGHTMNLQSILKTELAARSKRNPNYSMRSFAKFLEMDPSLLSKFLNGKRNLSIKTRRKIGEKINLPLNLVEGDKGSDDNLLRYFSDIRYKLILELMNLDEFRPNAEWVSDQLEIPLVTTLTLLEDLQRMKMLSIDEGNNWTNLTNVGEDIIEDEDEGMFMNKTYQKEFFDQVYKALDRVEYEKREHSAVMVATDADMIQEVKQRIASFRSEMLDLLNQSQKKNTVFQLAISFSPLNTASNAS